MRDLRYRWVRWIDVTKNQDGPAVSNFSACTDPDLSKNDRLLERGDDRPDRGSND